MLLIWTSLKKLRKCFCRWMYQWIVTQFYTIPVTRMKSYLCPPLCAPNPIWYLQDTGWKTSFPMLPSLPCMINFPSWLYHSQQHCVGFRGCYCKLQHVQWLKRTLMYYLTDLGIRSTKWICSTVAFWSPYMRILTYFFFCLLEATCILGSQPLVSSSSSAK